ncbi:hypothetical protein Tco_0352651 [Tanacetum coccineum]
MRLKTDIKPKEATFQVVLDALALTPFYHAFLITANVPAIYMQEFWATVSVHNFVQKIPRQVFEDLPLEQDILSFIRDLGHIGDITYLTDVTIDYLHQPWRAFSTVINKCLSDKETGMDKICLSRAQILWDAKKTNKMSYPKFTKIIIDYFMSKDPSISRRNKMFWHTTRDDTLFTSMRCISIHEDTQKVPKPKYIRKKADSDTSPKKKPDQATKGTRLKSKAKVAKPNKKKQPTKKTKEKGLAVLSEVALTEVEQIKLATKRSKKDFHISHASGSGDGVTISVKVSDVPLYESESDKESWGDSEDEDDNDDDGEKDDHDDDSDDERTETDSDEIPDPKLTNVD